MLHCPTLCDFVREKVLAAYFLRGQKTSFRKVLNMERSINAFTCGLLLPNLNISLFGIVVAFMKCAGAGYLLGLFDSYQMAKQSCISTVLPAEKKINFLTNETSQRSRIFSYFL